MFPSRLLIKERFTIFCMLVLLLRLSGCLPLTERDTGARDNFGFPENVKTVDNHSMASGGCKVQVEVNLTQQITRLVDGVETTEITPVTRMVWQCCDGYTGLDCNETIATNTSAEEANPCSGLNCTNHPDAVCAVVTRCGVDIPVFLNDIGEVVDCGNHRPLEDLEIGTCGNLCTSDPCAGQTCPEFPSALCLTSACGCKPLWLLETGVRVNCTSGEELLPERTLRVRRQTADPELPSCSR